jgi:hypothetical protein
VLLERTPVKLRLHGIDAPEAGQDFGARAKAAAAELAFGKVVTVRPLGTDRYRRGRVVAMEVASMEYRGPVGRDWRPRATRLESADLPALPRLRLQCTPRLEGVIRSVDARVPPVRRVSEVRVGLRSGTTS